MFQKIKKRQPMICMVFSLLLISLFLPIVNASQEIVDSDYHYGSQLGIGLILYKDTGELDPNYDYYAIKVTLADIEYQNDEWTCPYVATVRVAVPLDAIEPPGSHQPTAGFHSGQASISFSFEGIGFSMQLPAYQVSYSTSTDANFRYFDWTIDGDGWWFIFQDYAEFSVGIRVPQDSEPEVWAGGWAAWYTYYGLIFQPHSEDSYYWLQATGQNKLLSPEVTPQIPKTPKLYEKIQRRTALTK
ncbi:MAG: hypothetical protein NUK63_06260 [Candidatus Bathyarchaeum tardum]|nr:MAG: hypothetical protein NUK63_06260 [Candidatus Bathyarchaeum tardum]